jgi:hypothetical protein
MLAARGDCNLKNLNCKFTVRGALCHIGCLLLLAVFAGCGQGGPEVAPVSGRVTLDGMPLETADVIFQPEGSKSPSFGRTDKDGRYELGYKRGVAGAIIGPHTVSIAVNTEITRGPQLVPARYRINSELRREVESGKDNVFDFELSTDAQ